MKRLTVFLVTATAGICFISGCSKATLEPTDYVRYVENRSNGLLQTVQAGEVFYSLQYKPADYVVAMENGQPVLQEQFHQQRIKELGDMLYFTLEVKSGTADILQHGLQDEQEYYNRVNYYSLNFQQDINMVIASDTLPCALYQFENTYGVSPYVRMLLGFSGKTRNKLNDSDLVVLIDDRVFNTGTLKFNYDHKQITNVPAIKLN